MRRVELRDEFLKELPLEAAPRVPEADAHRPFGLSTVTAGNEKERD